MTRTELDRLKLRATLLSPAGTRFGKVVGVMRINKATTAIMVNRSPYGTLTLNAEEAMRFMVRKGKRR